MLAFFKWIDLHVPRDLDVHVVLDNLSAHKSEPVRSWLVDPKRARWHQHPTCASWLNLIEGWFSVLTRKALTNASFTSARQLEGAIDVWASHRNDDPQPSVWAKSVDDIITKVKRGRAALDSVTESATDHRVSFGIEYIAINTVAVNAVSDGTDRRPDVAYIASNTPSIEARISSTTTRIRRIG